MHSHHAAVSRIGQKVDTKATPKSAHTHTQTTLSREGPLIWFLHETPSAVVSANLHTQDTILTVSSSVISTCRDVHWRTIMKIDSEQRNYHHNEQYRLKSS